MYMQMEKSKKVYKWYMTKRVLKFTLQYRRSLKSRLYWTINGVRIFFT